jgi:NAD(P)-dependent dehydrogenase (short-subunit alcohol dehydrogenase family)
MPEAEHSRWVSPTDLAEVITFLASPENRATRGAVIPVYGGS